MDPVPSDLLDDLLRRAKAAGADAADAMLVEHRGLAVTRRLGKLEKVERAESHDLGLRVFVGKRQAIVSTGELDATALERLVDHAVMIARAVPEDRYAGLAEPAQIARTIPKLDLDDGVEPDADALSELAGAAEEAALANSRITNSEGAEAQWSRSRTTLAASNGFIGSIARSSHGLSASVIAGANGAMERDYEFASVVRAADLPDPATLGRQAAERAARRLRPHKVKSQAVPVVFEPRVAGSMIRHLVSAIGGAAVARGTTFLKDSMGLAAVHRGCLDCRGSAARRWLALARLRRRRHRRRAAPTDRPRRSHHLAPRLRLGAPARPATDRARHARRLVGALADPCQCLSRGRQAQPART